MFAVDSIGNLSFFELNHAVKREADYYTLPHRPLSVAIEIKDLQVYSTIDSAISRG
jgi:hypothetical protein